MFVLSEVTILIKIRAMKKLTVVVLVVMLVVPLGADRSSTVSSVITLETVVLARSTSTVR